MCSGFKWSVISIKYRGVFHRVFVYGPDPELQEEISTAVIDFQKRIDTYKAEEFMIFIRLLIHLTDPLLIVDLNLILQL